MAKRGLSVKEFMSMGINDLAQMTDKERRAAYRELRTAAFKRLKRLQENSLTSRDIYRNYREAFAEKPSMLSNTQIAERLIEMQEFLGNPESTVKGYKRGIQERALAMRGALDDSKLYGGLISEDDDVAVELWGDFMDTLRASSSYNLVYNLEDLAELWSVYQQHSDIKTMRGDAHIKGRPAKHNTEVDRAFEKFLQARDTTVLRDPREPGGMKSADQKRAERNRVNTIAKRKKRSKKSKKRG